MSRDCVADGAASPRVGWRGPSRPIAAAHGGARDVEIVTFFAPASLAFLAFLWGLSALAATCVPANAGLDHVGATVGGDRSGRVSRGRRGAYGVCRGTARAGRAQSRPARSTARGAPAPPGRAAASSRSAAPALAEQPPADRTGGHPQEHPKGTVAWAGHVPCRLVHQSALIYSPHASIVRHPRARAAAIRSPFTSPVPAWQRVARPSGDQHRVWAPVR